MVRAAESQRRLYGARTSRLFSALGDGPLTVVEIGAGAGPNARHLPAGTRWVAVEPNVHFHPALRRAAEAHGLDLEVVAATAETLPLGDASVDVVVSTLVLCSVDAPERALGEARRVLRPGGRLLFLEHVGAPRGSTLRRVQRAVRVPWGWVADGCRPDRDTEAAVRSAGFTSVESETFRAPLGVVSPHVMGVAVR